MFIRPLTPFIRHCFSKLAPNCIYLTNQEIHLQIRSFSVLSFQQHHPVHCTPTMPNVTEALLPTMTMKHVAVQALNSHNPDGGYIDDRAGMGPPSPEQQLRFQEQEALSVAKKLRASPEWHEVVAYGHLSESARARSLTASTLRGDGKIAIRPLKFFNENKTECILVAHLGRNMCGHEGIIHGGLLATLLDEHLAYITLPSLPNYTGFTANLSVDYRKPVKADQWVVVRGKLDRVEGRKAYANAWIETAEDGTLLTEASALYISPRMN